MAEQAGVIEYKCPCCNAGLQFTGDIQKLTCAYCDNTFEIDTVRAFNESENTEDSGTVQWDQTEQSQWSEAEQQIMQTFSCPACAGEILSDEHTAASFCPYCGNPTILPGRLSGGLRPDAVIPFRKTREDAQKAFVSLCRGKPLLPRFFTQEQQLEKITGMYVPFWLYDCDAGLDASYKATRIHHWSDSQYNYTKTDHFLLKRGAGAGFTGIPMDGSSKMDDTFMESIEPFDYGDLVDFDTAYLSGFLADKYDIPSESGEGRIRERVDRAMSDLLQSSFLGYATVVPTSRKIQIDHSKAKYVLLPVWMLNTRYKDKTYTFAMNGQTGKMTGTFPVCPKRRAAWFGGIAAVVTLLVSLIQML